MKNNNKYSMFLTVFCSFLIIVIMFYFTSFHSVQKEVTSTLLPHNVLEVEETDSLSINRLIVTLSETLDSPNLNSLKVFMEKNPTEIEIRVPLLTNKIDSTSEVVLFFKPECFAEKMKDFLGFLQTTLNTIGAHGSIITGVRVINGAALEQNNIIADHYKVINRIYTSTENIPDVAKERLVKIINGEIKTNLKGMPLDDAICQLYRDIPETHIVSFMQAPSFINRICPHTFPANMDPQELFQELWEHSSGYIKVFGGVYTKVFVKNGQKFIIVNGFHYEQLTHFCKQGSGIIAVSLRIPENAMQKLRDEVIGDTDAKKADPGSLRRIFYEKHCPLLGAGENGVHFSAGYLEGFYEMLRFFPQVKDELTFFFQKLKATCSYEENTYLLTILKELSDNPKVDVMVDSTRLKGNIFDITESKSLHEVFTIIKSFIAQRKLQLQLDKKMFFDATVVLSV